VRVGLSVAPYTAFHYETVSVNWSSQTYNMTFTMNESTTTLGSLDFYFGGISGDVALDNISLEEVDCTVQPPQCDPAGTPCDDGNPTTENDIEDGNCNCAGTPIPVNCDLIDNGTFDSDLDPWNYWGCDPSANYGWAYIGGLWQPGSNPWDAGFAHSDLLIEQGKTYNITFDAYGYNRNIDVRVGLSVSPYTAFHYQTVNVNWSTQTYNMTFTMTEPTTTVGSLDFYFGGINGDVGLDNINLEQAGCSNKEATLDLTHLIYPNPFSDKTNIEFEVPEDGTVSIFISDMTGKRVATLADNEPMPAGTHQRIFNGQELASGMYYCTVITGNYRSVRKVVLAK